MNETARRWRLILGRYADQSIGRDQFGPGDDDLEQALSYLYDRDYAERGHKLRPGGGGGSDPSQLTAITWLERTRKLFPKSTFERLQSQAIENYGLTEILADQKVASSIEPTPQLGAALLRVRGRLDKKLEAGLRGVISQVVDEIVRRVRPKFTAALSGRRNRQRRSFVANSRNFDWRRTINANLAHYDLDSQRLMINRPHFNSRMRRQLTWDVILCVDQSGSMASSVMYAAVCASILAGLPGVTVRLVVFDTSVVDLTHMAHDPIGVLMTVQLGGGTDIARAIGFCETLVRTPARTVLVLISDFEEGGPVSALLAAVSRLREAGVKLLGLAALDEEATPVYDRRVGGLLADRGMTIAALTPDHFAEWLAEVMQ